ncbi:adenosylcobalamin-dependent ribonucleoside-diphosphate reductase [Dehalococcoidia bacterium]|nr:adenosylcobalamin-dependent ribonucleoside-diphosphate reductase [Dehalococcoidia bacterium]
MTTTRIAPLLTDNAITILNARYLIGNETPEEMFLRVARAVAYAEAPDERIQWEEAFYNVMATTRFVPNSPTMFNAGTGQGTLSACFVLPLEDTMESIMKASTASAMIQKYGGGLGYAFSKLRPRGSHITTTQGKACGAIAVLKMLSSLSDMITQGGKRHGANMGILHVSHPEILEFIHMKDDNKTAQNFNVSVAVTDAFMKAVEGDEEWSLVDPHSGEVTNTLPAKQIWNDIVQSAWSTGDPGLYFIDESNRDNPTPHLGNLDSTNPCGEVPLLANEACNLGSIDLGKFVNHPFDLTHAEFDFTALAAVSRIGARFLDDVVTVNAFPVQDVKDAVELTRKTGLGVMGWHDALVQMGIEYESEGALVLGDKVMQTINDAAREVSIELAKERGPYPAWRPSYAGEPQIRNATRTCIAPTGTISAIAGASSGIEPIFALAFVKNVLDGKRLREVNQHFLEVAKKHGFYSEELMDSVAKTGSCQHLTEVPEDIKRLFKTAMEIDYKAHVRMQAAFQTHTDLAVSKTINMTTGATPQDIEEAYWMAYENSCKGITIYRDGSKPVQVLEVEGKKQTQVHAGITQVWETPRERPVQMHGVTERIRTGHGNTYITINFDDTGRPFEVFTTLGKAGGCDSANLEAISRLASLALRSGIRVDEVTEQLQGITCHPVWDQGAQVRSAPDAVAQALKRHVISPGNGVDGPTKPFDAQLGFQLHTNPSHNGNVSSHRPICPECSGPVAFQEGCVVCLACAWNECGG